MLERCTDTLAVIEGIILFGVTDFYPTVVAALWETRPVLIAARTSLFFLGSLVLATPRGLRVA